MVCNRKILSGCLGLKTASRLPLVKLNLSNTWISRFSFSVLSESGLSCLSLRRGFCLTTRRLFVRVTQQFFPCRWCGPLTGTERPFGRLPGASSRPRRRNGLWESSGRVASCGSTCVTTRPAHRKYGTARSSAAHEVTLRSKVTLSHSEPAYSLTVQQQQKSRYSW